MTAPSDAAPTRRAFLARAGASSFFVVTPRWLLAQGRDGPASRPASSPAAPPTLGGSRSFEEFLAKALATEKPAIVVRLPDDPDTRQAFLAALGTAPGDSIATLTPEAAELFADSVIACASRAACNALVPTARPGDAAILLDVNGRRVDGIAIPPADLADARALVVALRTLAHGVDGARLRARAVIAWNAASPRARAAFEGRRSTQASGDDWELADLEAVVSVIALERSQAPERAVARWNALLTGLFLCEFEEHVPGPLLPYGLELVTASKNGCGGRLRGRSRGGGACGMARMGPGVRRFVDLIAR